LGAYWEQAGFGDCDATVAASHRSFVGLF
jgi:hypothetical protein